MINEKLIPSTIAKKSDVDKARFLNNGTIIYENTDGTNSDINFDVEISKYKYFEICFRHQKIFSEKIIPNGRNFTIRSICWATTQIIQDAFLNYKIENNKFLFIDCGYINYSDNSTRNTGDTTPIFIEKIIAY